MGITYVHNIVSTRFELQVQRLPLRVALGARIALRRRQIGEQLHAQACAPQWHRVASIVQAHRNVKDVSSGVRVAVARIEPGGAARQQHAAEGRGGGGCVNLNVDSASKYVLGNVPIDLGHDALIIRAWPTNPTSVYAIKFQLGSIAFTGPIGAYQMGTTRAPPPSTNLT